MNGLAIRGTRVGLEPDRAPLDALGIAQEPAPEQASGRAATHPGEPQGLSDGGRLLTHQPVTSDSGEAGLPTEIIDGDGPARVISHQDHSPRTTRRQIESNKVLVGEISSPVRSYSGTRRGACARDDPSQPWW